VLTGGQTSGGTQGLTESLPDLRDELGTSVRDNVSEDALKAENVVHHEISRLPGREQFG